MGKKPVVKLRVYRGKELNYDAQGKPKNENHNVSLIHGTRQWDLFMKNLLISGYCKVDVDSVWNEVSRGKYEQVKDIDDIKKEVQIAFTPKNNKPISEEERINQLVEAKIAEMQGKKTSKKTETKQSEDDISVLREKYKELYSKNAFNGWDADTLKEKIAEKS